MTITVAGNKKEVADNLTVAQLIIDENVETPEYVTVTINDEFVKSVRVSVIPSVNCLKPLNHSTKGSEASNTR